MVLLRKVGLKPICQNPVYISQPGTNHDDIIPGFGYDLRGKWPPCKYRLSFHFMFFTLAIHTPLHWLFGHGCYQTRLEHLSFDSTNAHLAGVDCVRLTLLFFSECHDGKVHCSIKKKKTGTFSKVLCHSLQFWMVTWGVAAARLGFLCSYLKMPVPDGLAQLGVLVIKECYCFHLVKVCCVIFLALFWWFNTSSKSHGHLLCFLVSRCILQTIETAKTSHWKYKKIIFVLS